MQREPPQAVGLAVASWHRYRAPQIPTACARVKILIASPSYDGTVRNEYMRSVMALIESFRQRQIAWDLLIESATILSTMRSVMASQALLDSSYTHLLFIDTDLQFTVASIEKLITTDTDVIGCAYPYRTIPLHLPTPPTDQPLRHTISAMVPYALTFPDGIRQVDVQAGICEVQSIGTGLLLIRRQVLERLAASDVVRSYRVGFPYTQWYRGSTYHGFFSLLERDGCELGEDFSFCHRWTEGCGGRIHALVDQEVAHIGPLPVLGRYTDRLRSGKI